VSASPGHGAVLPAGITTLSALFDWRVSETPDACAYRHFHTGTHQWVDASWSETGARVTEWRAALAALELSSQARVAVLLPNGINAVCIDLAALGLGLVPVPLMALDNPESIAYIVGDCAAELLVLQDASQWDAIAALSIPLAALRTVVVVAAPSRAGADAAPGPRVLALTDWLAAGNGERPVVARAPTADDLAAVVYTSGTTGKPKGVMLTHRNVLENVKSVLARVLPLQSDVFLSFLPLSHTFERTAGYYLPIACGSCVAYVRSIAQIGDDLKLIKPTVVVSVPRIYERIYAKIQEQLQRAPAKHWLFEAAVAVGWRRFCRRQRIPLEQPGLAVLDALYWPLLARLVARPLRDQLGGHLRVAVSGGAPLSPVIARCFLGLGVPLLQGYGMTETSPVVAANGIDDNWPATVGRPLVNVEVRIGENRELQVRGPSVMKGYWHRAEDTQKAFTEDGWLRTGDQAGLEDGRIRILGRIKEIIVTSTGEKIAPADLELAIAGDALFDQVLIIGEGRPFLAAFVVLNPEQWKSLAESLKVKSDLASLAIDEVRQTLTKRAQAACRGFPRYAVPRVVRASLEPWSIQNGLMTPTLKIKRLNLEAHFQSQIDEIYRGRGNG
jgi:long-chain acyl-CoA synthetase